MISRELLKAVSPLVIGAATTPRMANIPPNTPNQDFDTAVTTAGAAAVIAKENKMPMLVFGLAGTDSIIRAARGEIDGTRVTV